MTPAGTPLDKSHIVSTPDIRGGKPRINGTRICVQDIYYWHELEGKSPDQIVDDFPHPTMADVYAALAFFWDHREQILEDLKRQDRAADEMMARFPSKLAEKLRARQGNDAVSPLIEHMPHAVALLRRRGITSCYRRPFSPPWTKWREPRRTLLTPCKPLTSYSTPSA